MNQRLHILFLCGWYPSRVLPTNGDFIQRHAEAAALKHTVTVIHIISDENVDNIEYTIYEEKGVKIHIAYVKATKNPFLKIRLFRKAYKVLLNKIEDFDLIHLNTLYPFGIFTLHQKWFKKRNYVISEHWTGYLHPQSKELSSFQKMLSKLITKNASYVVPVSYNLAENMQNLGLSGNYQIVPNVVDNTLFFPNHKKEDSFNILHISNMNDTHKNVSGLLNTLQDLATHTKHLKVTLIGEKSSRYKQLAKEKGLTSVKFVDQISHEKLNSFFAEADVFILFSNYENLPCVILESFAAGTPVISTNVGGISEFFPENFGLLIEKGNEQQLKKAILKIYDQDISFASKETMHQYAIDNFSKERIADQFSKLYFKALKDN